MKIKQIRKRDGRVVDFDQGKITEAVFKGIKAAGGGDRKIAAQIADKVAAALEKEVKPGQIPSVEEVQDLVERVLIEGGHAKVAKSYILYRQKRKELREEKRLILEKDEIDEVDKRFDTNALRVLKSRYLRKDEKGRLIETPKQLFTRIATHMALPELFFDKRVFNAKGNEPEHPIEEFDNVANENKISIGKYKLNRFHLEAVKRLYDRASKEGTIKVSWPQFLDMLKSGKFDNHEKTIGEFYGIMVDRQFMPNTPAIANFGNPLGMGSACFVLRVDDSLESIFSTLKDTAHIHQAGGGTGFNFSNLRPEGDFVSTTHGVASGPLSFMKMFDTMTDVIKQGGMRRGANMGILNSNHPDIEKFITAKEGNKALRNFNISVLIMPDLWEHMESGKPYPLVNPRTKQVVKYVDPRQLFDRIVYQAWESAEPGVIFFDRVNEFNPFYEHLGPIVTTNPCVAADTLIATENGLERIDSMKTTSIMVDSRAENLAANNSITLQRGCKQVEALQVVKTGIKDTYRLTTNSGYELTATADHKILTDSGWKELQKITEDDSILVQSGAGIFNKEVRLPFEIKNEIVGENGVVYRQNLPTEWSYELGLVLGWLTGDGWLSGKHNSMGLVFADEDKECRDVIQPIFEKYCNRQIKETQKFRSCVQLRSNSRFVVDFFKKLGVKDSREEREVPAALFTATKEAVAGFLQGLFSSDGSIGMGSESRNYARLNSSSLKLLKGVQLLLLNLGIRTSIYDRSTKPKKFKYTNARGELVIHHTSGTNYELNISKENLPKFLQLVGFIQDRHKNKIEKLKRFEFYREYFIDRVKSVEYAGKKEVWDITEPLTHSFIANGFVVHNCGEVLLYPNEPCNLGSINVWAFVKENDEGEVYVDWEDMRRVALLVARLMDNVIEVNKWPLQAIEKMARYTRKIGIGVMGVGDMLFDLGLPYNTDEGRQFMEQLMEFVNYWTKAASVELAKERGPMPSLDKSFYPEGRLPFRGAAQKEKWHFQWDKLADEIKKHGIRNGYTTIIAPTGSISMIAGCSSGMEPVYSLVFEKNVKVGSFYYVDPVFEKVMKREGLYDDQLMGDIAEHHGSIQNIAYIPPKMKKTFVVALDITPEDHIRALAAFQNWVDSSISKTNNFPANASVEYMKQSYILAYKLGCKDVTVFRDTSIKEQVLVAASKDNGTKQKNVDYVPDRLANRVEEQVGATISSVAHALADSMKATQNTPMHYVHQSAVQQMTQQGYAGDSSASGVAVGLSNVGLFSETNGANHNIANHADDVGALTPTTHAALQSEHAGHSSVKMCPTCDTPLVNKEGCMSCSECGYGLCSS